MESGKELEDLRTRLKGLNDTIDRHQSEAKMIRTDVRHGVSAIGAGATLQLLAAVLVTASVSAASLAVGMGIMGLILIMSGLAWVFLALD